MTQDTLTSLAAGITVLGVVWAGVLALTDPSLPVLAALGVASIGLLVLTLTTGDDGDTDNSPPGPDDLDR